MELTLRKRNERNMYRFALASLILTAAFFSLLMAVNHTDVMMNLFAFAGKGDAGAIDANDPNASAKTILKQMINIICGIFQAIGVVLSAYGIGSLVLAFKNEDPDSKQKSSTMVVIGIVLIAIRPIVNGLQLAEKITLT